MSLPCSFAYAPSTLLEWGTILQQLAAPPLNLALLFLTFLFNSYHKSSYLNASTWGIFNSATILKHLLRTDKQLWLFISTWWRRSIVYRKHSNRKRQFWISKTQQSSNVGHRADNCLHMFSLAEVNKNPQARPSIDQSLFWSYSKTNFYFTFKLKAVK